MKKTIIIILMLIIPLKVYSIDIEGITSNEPIEEVKEEYNIINDLSYRLVYKEDKDIIDFTIISVIISLMIIVMCILYKRKYYMR